MPRSVVPPGAPVLLDQHQAAKILGVTTRFLEKRRHQRTGPSFVRLSSRAIRYRLADLEEWIRENTVHAEETRGSQDEQDPGAAATAPGASRMEEPEGGIR